MGLRIKDTWKPLGNPDNTKRFDFVNRIVKSEEQRKAKKERKRSRKIKNDSR